MPGSLTSQSILDSTKALFGIVPEYKQFDDELIIHINSVLSILTQLGVGPSDGFTISDNTSTWGDFISDNKLLNAVKTYMYLRVTLMFDYRQLTSAVIEVIKHQIQEMEWRLNVMVETPPSKKQEV